MKTKYQMTKVSPLQTSKITALLYAPFGLFHVLGGIVMLCNTNTDDNIIGIVFLFMPLILLVGTFVMTLIWTAFYNWLASKVGGIEVELERED